jgi:alpha,alpha-trehalase
MPILKQSYCHYILPLFYILFGCQSQETTETPPAPVQAWPEIYQPAEALGELFHDAQIAGVFSDSKTLVDCMPASDPQEILSGYLDLKAQGQVNLADFIKENFELPGSVGSKMPTSKKNLTDHLNELWPMLTREPDQTQLTSSLLPLPFPYVVPGGRFREVYYWDSYFTMLGLLESHQDSLVINMIRNFAYLIDTQGFIPNGNRSYYLGRSQPPFFCAMVMLWATHHGFDNAMQFLPQMQKEYSFWMEGENQLSADNSHHLRVVRLPDGSILNRYWDKYSKPRPESYREDYEMVEVFPEDKRAQVYRDLRAGAESGWDYSSRWFSDGNSLDSIITTQILPVDLNCLMYFMEKSIAELLFHAEDTETANQFQKHSKNRQQAIIKYFWDPNAGYFTDYNIITKRTTLQYSAAGVAPLYFKIANEEQAKMTVQFLQKYLLYPGGIVSSTNETGQQWDFPNGWAPQQWMCIQGLRNYHYQELANDISMRWISLVTNVYKNTGKMMEKYNVVDLSLAAGGGEYPTQDGFGWTNGVTLILQANLKNHADSSYAE